MGIEQIVNAIWNKRVTKWMNEWMNEWVTIWMNELANEWLNETNLFYWLLAWEKILKLLWIGNIS